MVRSSVDVDWELAFPPNGTTTLLLVGRTGNGKSATGNSILGRKAFASMSRSSGVTTTSALQTAVRPWGHTINVIDTPGLFEVSERSNFVISEIARCVELARDGIDAILVVLTTRTRFSSEELAALRSLQALFGDKMVDHMILVFTGGDDLEADYQTLEDYLGHSCPHSLKELLAMCQRRYVLFDNRTNDETKKQNQVLELLYLVHEVTTKNGGQAYKDDIFNVKRNAADLHDKQELAPSRGYLSELKKKLEQSYEQQLMRITETIETKLKETTAKLEQQLAAEQEAREEAQKASKLEAEKLSDEIRWLREDRDRARNEVEELRKRTENNCAIL